MKPLGDLTGEMEILLEQMIDDHDLQHGEVLHLIKAWLDIHRAEAIEKYNDGKFPVFYYGHPKHFRRK